MHFGGFLDSSKFFSFLSFVARYNIFGPTGGDIQRFSQKLEFSLSDLTQTSDVVGIQYVSTQK